MLLEGYREKQGQEILRVEDLRQHSEQRAEEHEKEHHQEEGQLGEQPGRYWQCDRCYQGRERTHQYSERLQDQHFIQEEVRKDHQEHGGQESFCGGLAARLVD